MSKIKSIAASVYNYTHIFVAAGAITTSFLDTQALPPKFAAGIVIASQALKVLNDALVGGKTLAPVAEKLIEGAVTQVENAAHSAQVVPTTPLEPAAPTAIQQGYVQVQQPAVSTDPQVVAATQSLPPASA